MKFVLALLFTLCLTASLIAQRASKGMVSDAAHCVVHGDRDWLEGSQHDTLTVSAVIDKRSYPKQVHLILLVRKDNRSGQAFDIQLSKTVDKRLYTIQNNADFKMVGRHVSFTTPPLGGEWTQDHFAKSVAKAMVSPIYMLPLNDLSNGPTDLECSSYASAKQ